MLLLLSEHLRIENNPDRDFLQTPSIVLSLSKVGQRGPYITEYVEGFVQSDVQHSDSFGEKLVQMLPEVLKGQSIKSVRTLHASPHHGTCYQLIPSSATTLRTASGGSVWMSPSLYLKRLSQAICFSDQSTGIPLCPSWPLCDNDKGHTKNNSREKGLNFILKPPGQTPSLREGRTEAQSGVLEAGTEAEIPEERRLVYCSYGLFNHFLVSGPPRGRTTHSGQGSPTSIINSPQTCLQASLTTIFSGGVPSFQYL